MYALTPEIGSPLQAASEETNLTVAQDRERAFQRLVALRRSDSHGSGPKGSMDEDDYVEEEERGRT